MQEGDSNEKAGWVFRPESSAAGVSQPTYDTPSQSPLQSRDSVKWSASEYVANPKNTGWFALLAMASLVLAAGVYLVTEDKVSTAVIVILGVIVGIFAARQPQVLEYQVNNQGISIGQKHYPYTSFKSFSVVEEGAFSHVSLLPLRRFMPPLAIHYSPEDEQKIIDTLADYLPYEEHKRDIVENFTRRVRF